MNRRTAVAITGACAVLAAGAYVAGRYTVPVHTRTLTVIHVHTVTHVRVKRVVKWRTRTVQVAAGSPVVPCEGAGLGEVYLPAMGGTQAGLPSVDCTVSFYQGSPDSAGAFMRLTTVQTSQYPQPISDSYSLVQTGQG